MKQMRIRRLCLFCLWILSLVAISVQGGVISYSFFFGVTMIPILSFLYMLCVYFLFKIYQNVDSRSMVCGQPMSYFFVLQNESFYPFVSISVRMFSSFSYVEELFGDKEYELLAKDKYTYETKIVCKYRGEYEVGIKEIVVTDFLRLFRIRYRISEPIKALVKPKIVRVATLHSLGDFIVQMQRTTIMDTTEPDVVVRDYVIGDAIKQIHWKASAKEQTWKVRNRIGEEKHGIAILFDTKRYSKKMQDYIPLENNLLETVLALGVFLAEKNIMYEVYYGQHGLKKIDVTSIQAFEQCYEMVSDIIYRTDENFIETLKNAVKSGMMLQNKVFLLVLHELTLELMQLTEQLSETGAFLFLYVVTNKNIEDYVRQSNERRKIIVISVEEELEGRL